MSNSSRKLLVKTVADRLGVNQSKVLGWIRSGELRAIDVSTKRGGRPRWRIDETDLIAFESRRLASPPPTLTRRRRKPAGDVIEFF